MTMLFFPSEHYGAILLPVIEKIGGKRNSNICSLWFLLSSAFSSPTLKKPTISRANKNAQQEMDWRFMSSYGG